MDKELYEPDWEQCPHSEETYYEYDTGYREYDCALIKQFCEGIPDFKNIFDCSICPLAFKYTVEK